MARRRRTEETRHNEAPTRVAPGHGDTVELVQQEAVSPAPDTVPDASASRSRNYTITHLELTRDNVTWNGEILHKGELLDLDKMTDEEEAHFIDNGLAVAHLNRNETSA